MTVLCSARANPAPNLAKHLKVPRVSSLLNVSLSVHSLSCVQSSTALLPRERARLLIVRQSQLISRLSPYICPGGVCASAPAWLCWWAQTAESEAVIAPTTPSPRSHRGAAVSRWKLRLSNLPCKVGNTSGRQTAFMLASGDVKISFQRSVPLANGIILWRCFCQERVYPLMLLLLFELASEKMENVTSSGSCLPMC